MTKNKKLMLYIAKECGNSMWIHDARRDGYIDDDTINAINNGISANRDSLKKMLKNLENMGYACASTTVYNGDKVWSLTIDGRNEIISLLSSDEDDEIEDASDANDQVEKFSLECDKLAKKVMDLETMLEKKNTEIEALRNENLDLKNIYKNISNQTTSSYVKEAYKWANIANTIVNDLNESTSLKDENETLKHRVAAIQATLTETYKKLDEKTAALEKMENELARVISAFDRMKT